MARIQGSAITALQRLNIIVVLDRYKTKIWMEEGGHERMVKCFPNPHTRLLVYTMARRWDALTFALWPR